MMNKFSIRGEFELVYDLFGLLAYQAPFRSIQGGSNMTGTDLCANKPHCAAAVRP